MKQLLDSKGNTIGYFDHEDRHTIRLCTSGTIEIPKQIAMSLYRCRLTWSDNQGAEKEIHMEDFFDEAVVTNGNYIYNVDV